jgi:radical SAM additional 4Fe4S-binding domain
VYNLREIKFEVTDKCPLSCIHCSTDAGQTNSHHVTWADAQRIIREAFSLGVGEISFSGGEPLLWPELEKAVELANEHKITTTIYTTGIHDDAKNLLQSLARLGLNKSIFSLYGGSAATHDPITGSSGSFDKTINSMSLAVELGIGVGVHFVPMTPNYKYLPDVVELSRNLGAGQVSVLRLVPQGRGKANLQLLLNVKETCDLKKEISRLKQRGEKIRIGSPYNIMAINGHPHCAAGVDRLTIAPDLSIFPCDAFKQAKAEDITGSIDLHSNLSSKSLADCWENSTYLKAIRKYHDTSPPNGCRKCENYTRCLSGCVAQKFYHFNTLAKKPDPLCLKESD